MTTHAVIRTLRAMEHCTCRIDPHCLGEMRRLQHGLRCGILSRLQVLRSLYSVQRCPCYFATHCIETLCDLVEKLSRALRKERAARQQRSAVAPMSELLGKEA